MGDMFNTSMISAMGMKAQSERSRVIAENIANASTTGLKPGEEPYNRKVITFKKNYNAEHPCQSTRIARVSLKLE